MIVAPFTVYRITNTITDESASVGDFASSEVSPEEPADLREALDALESDFWDNVDVHRDGTIICYPADYRQDMRTGEWEADEVVIKARRPEWAERLVTLAAARRDRRRKA